MPEGDTIWCTAAALRRSLLGEVIQQVQPVALQRLQAHAVVAVRAVGKHLYIDFDSGYSLHSHMGMTGAWHLYSPGESWQQSPRRATAVLRSTAAVAVLFAAPRIELLRSPEQEVVLGPDILGATLDIDVVVSSLRRRGGEIAPALVDQSVCAGIGNIYKSESLWLCRVSPWSDIAELNDGALEEIVSAARRLMRQSTLGTRGPRAAYGRGGRPCPRCSVLIEVQRQGNPPRLTYFCPHCQVGFPSKHYR